jgi:CHASE1-domain containing sensor protein
MRSEYVAVSFIEPFQGNETALGYDVHSDKLRHEALDKARDTGEIAVTAPIRLVQDKGDQFGFLAFLAIYRNGTPHQTLEERRKNLTGYVVAVFRGRDVITAALKDLKHKGLPYRLTDQSAPEAEQLIYASDQKKFKSITLQEKGLFGKDLSPVSQGNRA